MGGDIILLVRFPWQPEENKKSPGAQEMSGDREKKRGPSEGDIEGYCHSYFKVKGKYLQAVIGVKCLTPCIHNQNKS